MRDVTTEDVHSIIWRKKEHGFDAAAGQIRGTLKRLCDYAVTCSLLNSNPVIAFAHAPCIQGEVAGESIVPGGNPGLSQGRV